MEEKEFMNFKVRGSFFATVRRKGKIIEKIEKHNLIVNTSCRIIAKALAGAAYGLDSFEHQISKIGIGTFLGQPSSWPESSVDKTQLDGVRYSKNLILLEGTYPNIEVKPVIQGDGTSWIEYDETNSPNDVGYRFYIAPEEFNSGDPNNPTLIWEFGLLRQDDTLFSMITRADMGKGTPIEKDEDVDISGYWKIQVRNTSL